MKIALYNKYRPQVFADLLGQEHVSRTLKNAIKGQSFSHAYLFTGPRGTGKTTVARLLAKALNCQRNNALYQKEGKRDREADGEPCNKCEICKNITRGREVDIVEIDAASNRGIDDVRELREKIKFAPSKLGYKVFIIDEVHMLTKEAFNALLKTLEEPPAHAVFILATTEIHKVPQTIISRCQRFDFKRITIKDLVLRLKFIAKQEGIKIEDKAIDLIAEASEGSFRDAISYLDQISSYKKEKISIEDVISILGITDFEVLFEFTSCIKYQKPKEAIVLLNRLVEDGYNMEQFTKNLVEFLRKLLLVKVIGEDEVELSKEHILKMKKLAEDFSVHQISKIIEIIVEFSRLFSEAILPQMALELAIIKLTSERLDEKTGESDKKIVKETGDKETPVVKKETKGQDKILKMSTEVGEGSEKILWEEILLEIKLRDPSLHALIKVSEPIVEDNCLTLCFPYRFHKEKVEEEKNKKLVEEILKMIYSKPYKIKCVLRKVENNNDSESSLTNDLKESDSKIETVLDIFGGEIIED